MTDVADGMVRKHALLELLAEAQAQASGPMEKPAAGAPTDYAAVVPAPLMVFSGVGGHMAQDAVEEFAGRFGMHPAFVTLIAALQPARGAYTPPPGPDDWKAISALVSPLPSEADLAAIVRLWIAAFWLGEPALRSRVSDPDIQAAADAIVDLHRRAARGDVIARPHWRAARTALDALLSGATGLEAACARIICASAWDIAVAPAVLNDIVATWSELLMKDADARICWGPTEERLHLDHMGKIRAFALEWNDLSPDTRISPEQFRAEVETLKKQSPAPAERRAEEQGRALKERRDLAFRMLQGQIGLLCGVTTGVNR